VDEKTWALRRQASNINVLLHRRESAQFASGSKSTAGDARLMESQLVSYLLDSATVVCCTLTGLDSRLLRDRQFDLVVIDEAAQAVEPACWIPLPRARRSSRRSLPIAADRFPAARQEGFRSLMERLRTLGDAIAET
jgi:hypothetical protein